MLKNRRSLLAGMALLAVAAAPATAFAQAGQDANAAPAGRYVIDTRHMAVLARVPHGGFSYEVFRFGDVTGDLTWNPANPSANQLSVTVNTASIGTPIEGFADELKGARFLNAEQFPQATFVSSAFRQIDATHGEVDGTLTIKGVAKQVTFAVELVGAGRNQRGMAIIGVHATTTINLDDYSLPGFITGQAQIVVDGEFDQQN